MKQVLVQQGRVVVEDVPAPCTEPGTVLVRVDHSCISVGTELSGVRASGAPLWKRALRNPEKVKAVLQKAVTEGVGTTSRAMREKLQQGTPTGYSAAGVVIEVGPGITDLHPGDRVACAGAQCAHHAEVIRVPRNLVTPIPEGLGFPEASTVTLGAIALQGIRRAQPTMGEAFVVIGLGILGQLTVQMLRANGCRVIGIDIDPGRVTLARSLGAEVGLSPQDGTDIEQVLRVTDGLGADGVIITAATESDAVISTAFRMCRKKGRVVLVGDIGLDLRREDFYTKELDFFISTSYGPGRYDRRYEDEGLDYPVGYVRWTENRNMSEYLRLLAERRVVLAPLPTSIFPVEDAGNAYASLQNDGQRPLLVFLTYSKGRDALLRRIENPRARPAQSSVIRVALVGAGGFAKGMHVPNLMALPSYAIHAVASRTGHNAAATAKQCSAKYATTEYQQVLDDPEVDLVLIATRHNLHASMVLEALRHDKHVFVEKPLALERTELEQITSFYASASDAPRPLLMTGFNRRFSVFAQRIAEMTKERSNPMIINYRMNAGYIPLDHWVHTAEGGGRNRGEACHIYDLFTFLTGSEVVSVSVGAITPKTAHYSRADNFVVTAEFADGSIATLTYTALGAREYPKEHMEVFVDGKVFVLDDYHRLSLVGARMSALETPKTEKGQKQELEALARALRDGGAWPIPLWQQIQATRMACDVEDRLHPTV